MLSNSQTGYSLSINGPILQSKGAVGTRPPSYGMTGELATKCSNQNNGPKLRWNFSAYYRPPCVAEVRKPGGNHASSLGGGSTITGPRATQCRYEIKSTSRDILKF